MYRDIRSRMFFVSCLTIAQMKEGKILTVEQYNSLWDEAHKPWATCMKACLGRRQDYQPCFKSLGSSKGFWSRYRSGWLLRLGKKSSLLQERFDACIEKIEQKKKELPILSFLEIVNKEGELLFDPYSPLKLKREEAAYYLVQVIDKA